jgi:hypothetical protein
MDSKESRMMVEDINSDDVKFKFRYISDRKAFYKMKIGYICGMLW